MSSDSRAAAHRTPVGGRAGGAALRYSPLDLTVNEPALAARVEPHDVVESTGGFLPSLSSRKYDVRLANDTQDRVLKYRDSGYRLTEPGAVANSQPVDVALEGGRPIGIFKQVTVVSPALVQPGLPVDRPAGAPGSEGPDMQQAPQIGTPFQPLS